VNTTLQTVHVRVNDAQSGQPTPVRIRFADAQGNYLAPFGRLTEFATGVSENVGGNLRLGNSSCCVIDGTCEIALPPGPVTIEVSKGFEYRLLRQEINLTPGKLAVRLNLERWLNLRAEGWCAGDGRAHFLAPAAALLEGAAEDLAVVNLLALHWQPPRGEPALPNVLAFSGQQPAVQMPGHMVVVNTLNTSPVGQLALLNCHRVVYPLTCRRLNWTMADWCDQCHRKGGLVAWPEHEFWPYDPDDDRVSEGLADLILGKVDAIEVDLLPWHLAEEPDWYTLLNSGLRVPLIGASRKRANTTALGCVRTYARLQPDEEFTYQSWIEAVRAGRTFLTNGPLLSLSVNGQGPGAVLDVPEPGQVVQVRAQARSQVPFERLEIVHNGAVVADSAVGRISNPSYDATAEASIELEAAVTGSGWWAARCWGHNHVRSSICPQPVVAHTSPVYMNVPGCPITTRNEAVQQLLTHLERFEPMLEQFAREGIFESDRDRERLTGVFSSARDALRMRLSA
jgi:hypothetical protein